MARERYATPEVLRERSRDYYRRKKAGLVEPRVVMSEEERKAKARAQSRKQYMRLKGYTSTDQIRETATQDEMAERAQALFDIVAESPPMTVRQVYYQAEVRGLKGISKDESGYQKVQRAIVDMRRSKIKPHMSWDWITDNTRSVSKAATYTTIEDALDNCAKTYWMDYWQEKSERVLIWIEKDALAGLVRSICDRYDVPFVSSRGVPSWGVLREAAHEWIKPFKGPTFVYTFYDFDPKGEDAWQLIKSALPELAPKSDIRFNHVGVTREQIERYRLPTRPTKAKGKSAQTRAAAFGPISCELDAFSADDFRNLIKEQIARHLPDDELERLQAEENANREELRGLIAHVK